MPGNRSPAPEVPAFTSDRMLLMGPFLTPNAIALGRRRVFEKGFRIARRSNRSGSEQIIWAEGSDSDLKSALLIAKQINPAEVFNGEEAALYHGADRKTIAGMKARGELLEK